MTLKIDPANNTPIYEQVINQIKYGIATGELAPDEPIPSIRQLSLRLLINPNTVIRAYRELEREGVIEMRRGLGAFVTRKAPDLCGGERKKIITQKLGQAIAEALDSRLSVEDIRRIIAVQLERAAKGHRP
jgi:GntR family transcriptional regulator